jgi:predicted oxidoreductase
MKVGFGCASLGSRVSETAGLSALNRAYDAGVRWYDIAPSYGDGEAEIILGKFLDGRRGELSVCTKVGILPPKASLSRRLLRPAMRTALTVAPGLRQIIRRHRPDALKPPLDAASILPSLETSLRRLGTDYVDVLALHGSSSDEVVRDDILNVLEGVLESGKARRISIASSGEAAVAGLKASSIYSVAQVANNVYKRDLAIVRTALPRERPFETVTHTVFGASGMVDQFAGTIERTAELKAALADAGYLGNSREQAFAFLPDFAFTSNIDGVVLLSMFGRGHLEANLARIERAPDRAVVAAIANLVPALTS